MKDDRVMRFGMAVEAWGNCLAPYGTEAYWTAKDEVAAAIAQFPPEHFGELWNAATKVALELWHEKQGGASSEQLPLLCEGYSQDGQRR